MKKFLYLILLSLLLCSCSDDEKINFHGSDITKAKINGNFNLIDQNGIERELSDFNGDVVAIFFGFTNCPDVCPTTLIELKEIYKKIDSGKFQVLFVTLDPERDSKEVLKEYLSSFDKAFIGLTGSSENIVKMAQQYKVYREKVGEGERYTIDHGSAIYLIDQLGAVRLRYPYGFKIEGIIEDIRKLID
ncbi:MAG: SCO family protein [Nitrosomonadales bacterium]|jgi:protein SCO1/2|nr:SCO family protein [Nitrosomonadales bacterium]